MPQASKAPSRWLYRDTVGEPPLIDKWTELDAKGHPVMVACIGRAPGGGWNATYMGAQLGQSPFETATQAYTAIDLIHDRFQKLTKGE